jgi:hypothetical protein
MTEKIDRRKFNGLPKGSPSGKKGKKYSDKVFEWRKRVSYKNAILLNRFAFSKKIISRTEFDKRQEFIEKAQKTAKIKK